MTDASAHPRKEGKQTGDSTDRTAPATVHNLWGETLEYVILRHRRGNDADKQDEMRWDNVKDDEDTLPHLTINYETGAGADGDYWWVKFKTLDGGEIFASKGSFFCDLTSDDENRVVIANVDAQGDQLKIIPAVSSSCVTNSIEKQ
jgi:hypothetical protein